MAQHAPCIMTSSRKLSNYLRTFRRRAGLSQRDVAYLLGGHDSTCVSRYEHFTRSPSFQVVLAYAVIFHLPIDDLFCGEYLKVEGVVHHRARRLADRLDACKHDHSADVERRLLFLRKIITATSADDQTTHKS